MSCGEIPGSWRAGGDVGLSNGETGVGRVGRHLAAPTPRLEGREPLPQQRASRGFPLMRLSSARITLVANRQNLATVHYGVEGNRSTRACC